MSDKPNNFKLGLFVMIGVLLLLTALFIFGASKWFEGKMVEETYVTGNVDGLKTGSPVTLRGVPVGEVTRINFTWNVYNEAEPRYVIVEFEVHRDVSLVPPGPKFAEHMQMEVQRGLRARVKSQGLAGATILSLEYLSPNQYPPLKFPWTPRHVYIPSAPSQLSEIIASLDQTTAKIKRIDFEKLGQAVEKDLAAGERLLAHLERTDVPAIATNATALLADLRGVSAQLHDFIGHTNQLARDNLPTISSNADRVLVEMEQGVGRLDRVLANFDSASLNETMDNLRRASENLEGVVEKLKQYPAGMLFGKPPAPARSVENPRK